MIPKARRPQRRRRPNWVGALGVLAQGHWAGRELLIIVLCSGAGALLSLIVPIAAGWLYGTLIPHGSVGRLPWFFASLASVALALSVIEYLRGWSLLRLLARGDRLLHSQAFARLLHSKPGYLRRQSSANWAGRLVGLADARRSLGPPALNAVLGLFVGLANFVFMVIGQPLLAVVALLLTLLLAGLTARLTRRQLAAELAKSHWEGRIAGFTGTLLANWTALRRAGAQARAGARQRQLFAALQAAHARGQRAADTLLAVQAGFALAAPLALFGFTGLVLQGLEPDRFLAFYTAFGQLLFAALGAVTALTTLTRAAAPVYRILPLLQAPQEDGGSDPGRPFQGLALERVTFRYEPDAAPALKGMDFGLEPGEIVVLTGASGSGKTTVLKLILGLEEAQEGVVRINGRPLTDWNPQALRRLAGVALQASPLFPGTVAANIAGFRGAEHALQEAAALAGLVGLSAAHPWLPQGLATEITDPLAVPERLRQGITLARALIGRPSLLLLDEVTGALPVAAQARVMEHIRASGAACVVITHSRAAMAIADRVVLLAEGRVAAEGRYSALLAEEGPFARFIRG